MTFQMRLEFRLSRCYVGAHIRASIDEWAEDTAGEVSIRSACRLDIWICLIPCIPLHIVIHGTTTRQDTAEWAVACERTEAP